MAVSAEGSEDEARRRRPVVPVRQTSPRQQRVEPRRTITSHEEEPIALAPCASPRERRREVEVRRAISARRHGSAPPAAVTPSVPVATAGPEGPPKLPSPVAGGRADSSWPVPQSSSPAVTFDVELSPTETRESHDAPAPPSSWRRTAALPCEFCGRLFRESLLGTHMSMCTGQEQEECVNDSDIWDPKANMACIWAQSADVAGISEHADVPLERAVYARRWGTLDERPISRVTWPYPTKDASEHAPMARATSVKDCRGGRSWDEMPIGGARSCRVSSAKNVSDMPALHRAASAQRIRSTAHDWDERPSAPVRPLARVSWAADSVGDVLSGEEKQQRAHPSANKDRSRATAPAVPPDDQVQVEARSTLRGSSEQATAMRSRAERPVSSLAWIGPEAPSAGTTSPLEEPHLMQHIDHALVPCDRCGRTFLPDRLEVHRRACKGLGGFSPVGHLTSSTTLAPVACLTCSHQYSAALIEAHQKTCRRLWEKDQREAQSRPSVPDLPLSGAAQAFADPNEAALLPCERCGRTFLPDRLQVHLRGCKGISTNPRRPEAGLSAPSCGPPCGASCAGNEGAPLPSRGRAATPRMSVGGGSAH
eukprot:NODE_2600_length_2183_cov_8.416342.p1 GENE.NODE_2600_length_2183_cov_8.416342~~NODE_2600_length_2183_cov_8.416342.p1  ORF type:complete len:681 (+),score=128.29 NODE_2600_length_2183_cov_8.416342:261-2045(+)